MNNPIIAGEHQSPPSAYRSGEKPTNDAFITGKGELDPRGPWMQTYTGRQFFPLSPHHSDIVLEDIAHALSLICRFNGHCEEFYSVAQHSIFVSQMLPPKLRLAGLLHDAAEAYLGDLVKPQKTITKIDGVPFRDREDVIMQCIAMRYELAWPLDSEVKQADLVALATEKRDLMKKSPQSWIDLPSPLSITIWPLSPVKAEFEFLRELARIPI